MKRISIQKIVLFVLIFSLIFPILSRENIIVEANNKNIELTFDEEINSDFELVESLYKLPAISIWHYSGGYWGNDLVKIKDSDIEYDLTKLEPAVIDAGGYPLEVKYPEKIKQAIQEGKKVIVQLKSHNSLYDISEFINNTEDINKHILTDMGNSLKIKTFPKFNYEENEFGEIIDYKTFGFETKFKIPLIKEGFGKNLFSIWTINGNQNGHAEWFASTTTKDMLNPSPVSGKINPAIMNPNGTLLPGYTIETTYRNTGEEYKTKTVNSSQVKIGHNTFNSGGALGLEFVYPFEYNFYVEKESNSGVILTELKLIDIDTGKVLESFERKINNLDPMNIDKQQLIRTNTNPYNASILEKNKNYKIKAKYQFVSFEEGNFDILKPEMMTEKQRNLSTKITPNQIEKMYAYDDNWDKDGVFDESGIELSTNKPYTELKNLEIAEFEWNLEIPKEVKKYIKIASRIPQVFTDNKVDTNEQDNWGLVFGRIEPIDIGMASPIEILENGTKSVKFVESNKKYTAVFNVKHFLGEGPVGLDSLTNPKVKINVVVEDLNSKVLLKQTIQTDLVLYPNQTIKMPMSNIFSSSNLPGLKVCATIDPIHKEKGYNDSLLNDTICATFLGSKNYAIRDLKATPMSIHFEEDEKTVDQPVTLDFVVANESLSNEAIPSNPTVVIKYGDTKIWEGTVSVASNSISKITKTFILSLIPGNNNFSVEVNPYKIVKEYVPGVENPYLDNKKTTSILGVPYSECDECLVSGIRHKNTWQEKWEWEEQRGEVRTDHFDHCLDWELKLGTRCCDWDDDGGCIDDEEYYYYKCCDWDYNVPYEYCYVTYEDDWEEIHDYYEEFKITDILFRSKWSKDNNLGKDGWISVKDGKSIGKIKAGYGFELNVITNYNTNRYKLPLPNPTKGNYYQGDKYGVHGSGYCDFIKRYPGVTPIDSPNQIYMTMPYFDNGGKNVCYILRPTKSTAWYYNNKVFDLPVRSSFGIIENERKIYINEKARPAKYTMSICTPRPDRANRFWGYYPNNLVNIDDMDKKYLHDCATFTIEILPQDDIKSHITQ